MKARTKKSGFSLTEIIVTMSIVGVLAGIGIPAVRQVKKSFESSSRVRDVVAAAFSNARARALARGGYVGLRFQRDLEGNQYMVFIEYNDSGVGPVDSFRPVTGKNPIRLPKNGLLMDMHIRSDDDNENISTSDDLERNDQIDTPEELTDATTFCVIFSKAGKLVQHESRIWVSTGDIFNTEGIVNAGLAMFYYDIYPGLGLGKEVSRNNFIIVDKNEFKMVPVEQRWTRYLKHLKPYYINPYTGGIFD